MRGSSPASASARTSMSSSDARTRPAELTSLSAKVAIPSMNQSGWMPFGIQILPKTSFTPSGNPSTVSRWRMWVYSWAISSYALSSKSASVLRESGGDA